MPTYKIIIAGAGLGGLSAAINLLNAGHDVEIYEQAPALGEVGAGIQLSANAMHVLNHMGVGEKIARDAVRPQGYVFKFYDTAEVVQQFSLSKEHEQAHGAPYLQTHRADLHATLAQRVKELKSDVVHLNKQAARFDEDASGVTLHFTDGTSVRGDILIGADGLKSVVQSQISGPVPASYTGDSAWRITVPVSRLPKDFMPQVMAVWMGPGAHAVCYYVRGGQLLNFVGIIETSEVSEESWTQKFPWEKLKADFAGWHQDIQTLIDAADKDQCYRWALHIRQPIKVWHTGRVTLLGDAVHPTLPYLAQGAAMAIEDGAVLTRALEMRNDITEALDLYQRNRAERTARIVRESTGNRGVFHARSKDDIRTTFAKRDMGAERNAWLYSYNPLTVELT